MSNSSMVHIWSVMPAAIAGVRCSHSFGEPLPFVGIGIGNGRRRLLWDKQKL